MNTEEPGGNGDVPEDETGDATPGSSGNGGPWEQFVGEKVVIDTPTRYIYLGTLVTYTDGALVLENVDVHDSDESESTKEVYIMKAADQGIRVNRERVIVPERRVLSMSTLDDTVVY